MAGVTRKPFRLGLVGAGRMGRTHLAALSTAEGVETTAIVDPRPAVLDELCTGGIAGYRDLAGLVAAKGVDGVLVAAPTPTHAGIIESLAEAGLPILCEKPCGSTPEEARRSLSCAEREGVPLQIAYWRRYVPELVALRDRIRAGGFGKILSVHSVQWDEAPPAEEFRRGSGGIFIDMAVHEFDQVRWLTGQEFSTLHAVTTGPQVGYRTDDDADGAEVVATLSGGSVVVVSAGRFHPGGDICRIDVFGNRDSDSVCFLKAEGGTEVLADALRCQAEDFVRLARGDEGRGATGSDAVAALEVAQRATVAMTCEARG